MNLPKVISRRHKRQGQGHGSGKGGHTSGRGMKGQKARSHKGILFEGLKVRKSLYKRLPLKRGKDKLKAGKKPLVVDLSLLNLFDNGATVTIDTLIKIGIVQAKEAFACGVKVLGGSDLSKKLTVEVPTSKSAKETIEKAGGTVQDKSQAPNSKKQANSKL
jgi:large subunit ribosomal protein L15